MAEHVGVGVAPPQVAVGRHAAQVHDGAAAPDQGIHGRHVGQPSAQHLAKTTGRTGDEKTRSGGLESERSAKVGAPVWHGSMAWDPKIRHGMNDMKFCVDAAEFEALKTLCSDIAQAPLHILAALAWHSRQRDSQQAIRLVDLLEARPEMHTAGDAATTSISLRCVLVRAEVDCLMGHTDRARERCERLELMTDPGAMSALGRSRARIPKCVSTEGSAVSVEQFDRLWVLAWTDSELGQVDDAIRRLERARDVALALGDTARRDAADLRALNLLALNFPSQAQLKLTQGGFEDRQDYEVFVQAMYGHVKGLILGQSGNYLDGTAMFNRALAAAQSSGQIHLAIRVLAGIGINFIRCSQTNLSLEAHERSLRIARAAGWPPSIGNALAQMGWVLVELHRIDTALSMLTEALTMVPPKSRNAAMVMSYMAYACSKQGDARRTQAMYEKAEALALEVGASDMVISTRLGQAEAAVELGEFARALALGETALADARTMGLYKRELEILYLLAQVYRHAPDLPSHRADAPSPSLSYLREAQALETARGNQHVPSIWLADMAAEYARLGDLTEAYALSLQAAQARDFERSEEARNRAVGLEVRFQSERLQMEADALQQANGTLELLGAVGRDITTRFDMAAVFQALDYHVRELLVADALVIYEIDDTGRQLCLVFGVEGTQALPERTLSFDDERSHVARCARQRAELIVGSNEDPPVAGSSPMRSLMFAPLMVEERLLGVMTIQARAAQAYADRERSIFRTLCAYGAIAMANARMLRSLRRAQTELELKNQELALMATTDRLTGLVNRFGLEEALERALERARSHQEPFAVLLMDMDHFKRVNDLHGHAVGDDVLVRMGATMRSAMRVGDVAGRWGGEEFLVVLADADEVRAMATAESLRRRIEAVDFGTAGRQTVCIGVALYREGDCVRTLESRADRAMYRAKQTGRNRVVGEARSADLESDRA